MTENQRLLLEYAENGSEEAIRELVTRYINLVYSTAIRLVDGETQLAEDVTQTVFLHLVRNARKLAQDPMLAGWLHRDTCFVAAKAIRGERRRQARERHAVYMHSLQDHSEDNLEQVKPLLDEAINQLGSEDRAAILLRFFEQRDFRGVAEALGSSEDAARMRVTRALEKLRQGLHRRGIAVSAAALTAALASRSLEAAPAGLAGHVTLTVLKASTTAGGLTLLLLKIMASTKLKLTLASIVVLALALTPSVIKTASASRQKASQPTSLVAQAATPANSVSASNVSLPAAAPAGAVATANTPYAQLRLTVLDAVDGKPLRSVQISGRHDRSATTSTDRDGQADIPYPPTAKELDLTLRKELFADTRLCWEPKNGDKIPAEYTVRLSRAVKISGQVLGPNDEPVEGARVGFNHEDAPDAQTRPASHEFFWVETLTDSQGRWEITRVAQDMLYRLYGHAMHPDYIGSPLVFLDKDHNAAKQLLDGTHIFRLAAAISVSGIVLNAQGQPIADASVLAGHTGESGRRETKSASDGTFSLRGCAPGKSLLTGEAPGYAATTLSVEFTTNSQPFKLVLQGGKTLKLRVVDKSGKPIVGANVWLNTMNQRNESETPLTQTDFSPTTDQEGRVFWDSAPDKDLQFDIAATGYKRKGGITIHPDGQEHIVTLTGALVISGTASDAATGQPIPKFKLVCGWPQFNYPDNRQLPRWSTLDRFTVNFNNGTFRHVLEEEVCRGYSNCLFKIVAEGYSTYISRVIQLDEGEVQFDVRLRATGEKTINVVLPNGNPAVGATVAVVTSDSRFYLNPGGFDRTQSSGTLLTVEDNGTFHYADDDAVTRLIIACPDAYAEARADELQNNATVVMKPWGSVEGLYRPTQPSETKPEFLLGIPQETVRQISFDFNTYKIETDASGKFTWPHVPPGRYEIIQLIPFQHGTSTGWSHKDSGVYVDVTAGQTANLVFPGGYVVSVHLTLPGAESPTFAFVRTPRTEPPPEVARDPNAMTQWYQRPEIAAESRKVRIYPLKQMADGAWSTEGVPAGGAYVVESAIMGPPLTTNGPRKRLFEVKVPFTVPADPTTGAIDLGEFELGPLE